MTMMAIAQAWLNCPDTIATKSKAGAKRYNDDAIERTKALITEGVLDNNEIGRLTGVNPVSVSRIKTKLRNANV